MLWVFSNRSGKAPSAMSLLAWLAKASFLLSMILIVVFQVYNSSIGRRKNGSLAELGKVKDGSFQDGSSVNFEDNMGDFVCFDRYGKPIKREEARLVKKQKTRKSSFLTIGIPTIERNFKGKKKYYLSKTLKSLLDNLSDDEKKEVTILIFCGDEEPQKRESVIDRIKADFSDYIDKGMIDIIYAPKRYYKRLNNLPRNFKDTEVRIRWRSKQCLDYAFMFYYASGLSKFYLHLEDDIESSPGYYKLIKDDASVRSTGKDKWVIRKYYDMGFIGKLIPIEYVRLLADWFRLSYYQMPLDWLHHSFIGNVNGGGKESVAARFPFKHIGHQSSSKNNE